MAAEVGTLAEALYDFDGVREDNVTFKKGEIITIIEMNESGWWKGMNSEGKVGIFPYNYCQVRSPEANFPYVKAIADFEGQSEEDLSFAEGDIITVLREISKDWSEGKSKDGRRGRFPNNYTQPTGEYDEETLKEETEKWERIEKEKLAEAKKRQKEREELERKLREEEEKRKKLEEEERKKREEEEEKERLKQEAAAAKRLAAKLENEKMEKEAELKKQQLILQQQLEKAEMEQQQRELELKKQAAEAKRKAEEAERELEQARAEAAHLRKKQEAQDARKSKVILQKVTAENEKIQLKAQAAAIKNQGHAPGRAPPLKAPLVEQEVPEKKEEEAPKQEEKEEEKEEEKPKKKKKQKGALQPVYLSQEEAPPEEEKKEEEKPKQRRNRRKNKAKPVNPRFAHLGGGSKCPECGESVGVGDRVQALGQTYHTACFTCSTCSKVLRNGEYRDHEGTPYCTNCHSKGFGIGGYGYGVGAGVLQPKPVEGRQGATGEVEKTSLFAGLKD